MPGSSNSQSRGYLARMLSVNSNGTVSNGNAASRTNLKRVNEELRTHILKLKSDVDSEKNKSKQTHREKVAEIKRMKDDFERENHRNLELASSKMNTMRDHEIKRLRESLTKDKDLEIKQIIKFKDEEIKTLQKTMIEEKEQALRKAEETFFYQLSSRNKSVNDDLEKKLRRELVALKKSKEEVDENFREQMMIVAEKNEFIKKLRCEHDRELQRVLREARRENSRSLSELQSLKRSLNEKTTEVNKLESYAAKVSEEKEEILSEKIKLDRLNISMERNALSLSYLDEPLSPRMERERDLHSKNAELRRQLDVASKRIKQMEKENNSLTLSSTMLTSDLNALSASDKRIRELKKRNSELVAIAKKLEEKSKQIQKELNDVKNEKVLNTNQFDSVNTLKKSFAIQRAKDLADHARAILVKDKELEELRQRKDNHEEQIMFKEIEKALQLAAKERLRLERQLSTSPPTATVEDLTHLKSELNTTHEKLKEMSDEYTSLQKVHSSCSGQQEYINEKLEEVDLLTNQLKVKEEECVALSKSLMSKDKEMIHLRKEMKEKEKICCDLIKGNDLLKSNVKILEENIGELKMQLRTMEQLRHEYKELETELSITNNKCEGMLKKIQQLEFEIDRLKKQINNHLEDIDTLETTNTSINRDLKLKTEEIEGLKKIQEELTYSHDKKVTELENHLQNNEERLGKLINTEKKLLSQLQDMKLRSKQNVTIQSDGEIKVIERSSTDNDRVLLENVFEDETKSPLLKKTSTSSFGSETDAGEYSIRSEDIGARINQLAVTLSEAESLSEMKQEQNNSDDNFLGFETDNDEDDADDEADGLDATRKSDSCEAQNEINQMIESYKVSGNNPVKLFISRYTYDPSLYSPNEDHDMELPLELGMYLYVYGDMDEDGFYLAELQSGKRGLVPSNLIERADNDLSNTGDQPVDSDDDLSEENPIESAMKDDIKDAPIAAEYLLNTNALKTNHLTIEDESDVVQGKSFMLESEDEEKSKVEEVLVLSPRQLSIERELNTSIVITWKAPIDLRNVKGYAIYVNNFVRQTVLGSARTKALVSDIQTDKVYRISVRTVKTDGKESSGDQAVLTVGKGPTFSPYDLVVSDLTTVSANISWKPSNSSYYHVIYVNDNEVTSTRPGIYQTVLRELVPRTHYNVIVQARKHLQRPTTLEWSASIEFTTLEGVRPEAPLDVSATLEDDRILISWIPVTINKHGTSNGSLVTGYKIYVENLDLIFVNSATIDHTHISFFKIKELFATSKNGYTIFVRTQSTSGESETSNVFFLKIDNVNNAESTLPLIDYDFTDHSDREEMITPTVQSDVFQSVDFEQLFEEADQNTSLVDQQSRIDGQVTNLTHYNPENDPTFVTQLPDRIVVGADDERIIVSDDDLSVIEEEESDVELELPNPVNAWGIQQKAEQSSDTPGTGAERTDTVDTGGETLLDISSENKFTSTERSQESCKDGGAEGFHATSSNTFDVSHSSTDDISSSSITQEYVSKYVEKIIKHSRDLLDESNPTINDDSSKLSAYQENETKIIFSDFSIPSTVVDGVSSLSEAAYVDENVVGNAIQANEKNSVDIEVGSNIHEKQLEEDSVDDDCHVVSSNSNENMLEDIPSTNDTVSQFTDSIEDMLELDRLKSDTVQPSQTNDKKRNSFDKNTSNSQTYNIENSDPAKVTPSSYSLNSKSGDSRTFNFNNKPGDSIDENHNTTYSLNSYIVIPSSVNLNSADLINRLEKDAHRDMLDDFPDFPLDNQSIADKVVQPIGTNLTYNQPIGGDIINSQPIEMDDFTSPSKDEMLIIETKDQVTVDVNPKISGAVTSDIEQKKPNRSKKSDDISRSDSISILTKSSTDVDDDSIETGVPLSSFQLSSVKSSRDSDPTNQPSSIAFSEDDNNEIEKLLVTDIPIVGRPSNDLEYNENVAHEFISGDDVDLSSVDSVSSEASHLRRVETADGAPQALTATDAATKDKADEQLLNQLSSHVISLEESSISFSTSAKRSLNFNDIAVDKNEDASSDLKLGEENSESLKLTKPLQNIYTFGDVDVSNSEHSDTEIDISAIAHDLNDHDDDDDDEFDVTPIDALDDTTESNVFGPKDTPPVTVQDSSKYPLTDAPSAAETTDEHAQDIGTIPKRDAAPDLLHDKDIPDALSQPDRNDRLRIFVALYPYNPLIMSPNVEYVDDELAFEEGALIKVYGEIDEDGFYFGELDDVTGMIPGNMVAEVPVEDIDRAMNKKRDESETSSEVNNKTDSFDVSFMVDRKNTTNVTYLSNSEPSINTDADTTSTNDKSRENMNQGSFNAPWKSSSTQHLPPQNEAHIGKASSVSDVRDARKNERIDPYKLQPQRMIALFDYDPAISSPNVDAEIELAFGANEIIHVYGETDEDGFYVGKINGRKGLVPSNFIRVATDEDDKKLNSLATAANIETTTSKKSEKAKKKNSLFRKSKKIFSKLTRK